MDTDKELKEVKCPDCELEFFLRVKVEGELGSWLKVIVYCPSCLREWPVIYTGTGSV